MAKFGTRKTGDAEVKVFLSHSNQDKRFARRLKFDLERAGENISTWLDEVELRIGSSTSSIAGAIEAADCLVVVVSKWMQASAWVAWEVEYAESLNRRVLPVLLDQSRSWVTENRAFSDFRRPEDYRRSFFRLVGEIKGSSAVAKLLSAKDAARLVKSKMSPRGDLFGVSQQGVGSVYGLANRSDWEFADAASGFSRFWVLEYFNDERAAVKAYVVVDGEVYDSLPEAFLLDSDVRRLSGSVVNYSWLLGDLGAIANGEQSIISEEHRSQMIKISKQYTPFRPFSFVAQFVDSDVAARAALESGKRSGIALGIATDVLVLMGLERDKRSNGALLWKVSLFDPTLTSALLTVGIDATTGEVVIPSMRPETLNGDFFSMRHDAQSDTFTIDAHNQLRAISSRVWDLKNEDDYSVPGLSAHQALTMTSELLQAQEGNRSWQLGFVSNTGVADTAISEELHSASEGLLRTTGLAGQWVVEVFGHESAKVRDGHRVGYRYDFRQIVCTRDHGATFAGQRTQLILEVPLEESPLPPDVLQGLERARKSVIAGASTSFEVMSVAMRRRRGRTEWFFRLYDSNSIVQKVTYSGDGQWVVQNE